MIGLVLMISTPCGPRTSSVNFAFGEEMLRVAPATVLLGVTWDPGRSDRLRVDADVRRLTASEPVLVVARPDVLPAVLDAVPLLSITIVLTVINSSFVVLRSVS